MNLQAGGGIKTVANQALLMKDQADTELFDRMAEKVYVAVISDMLDGLGYRNQVMHTGVRPVRPDPRQVLVGRAATMLVAPQYETVEQPYTNQIAAIDALRP